MTFTTFKQPKTYEKSINTRIYVIGDSVVDTEYLTWKSVSTENNDQDSENSCNKAVPK